MDIKLIGQRIQMARKQKGMTVEQIAEELGFATESVSHIEGGSSRPSLRTFLRIADILDVSLDFLAGRTLLPQESLITELSAKNELTPTQEKLLLELAETLLPIVKKAEK